MACSKCGSNNTKELRSNKFFYREACLDCGKIYPVYLDD